MSISFARLQIFVMICLSIAHAYPSTMSKNKWLQAHAAYRPHTMFEITPDQVDTDLNDDDDGTPTWLFRSRKFCCAPPL